MKYIFVIALFFAASPLFVSAHPGNTDSSGGHYCRTNCDYWGVPWNQWHSHGGNSYRPPSNFTSPAPTVPTYKSNMDCPSYGFAYLGDCYQLPANAKKSAFSGFECNYGYEAVGFGLSKQCLPKVDNGYRIGSLISCNYGYELYINSCLKKSNSYSFGTPVLNTNTSNYSCPKNSMESVTDPSKCNCNLGYEVNSKKDSCKKISKKTNDKLCRADFGKNSQWTGKYNEETENPYCGCKKKFEWNTGQTACIKS